MFTLPELDTQTIILIVVLLAVVLVGSTFGLPYLKEGLEKMGMNTDAFTGMLKTEA
jgi:hypothetical protein